MSIDLDSLGWGEDLAAAFAPYRRRGLRPGRVLRVDQGVCVIFTAAGIVRGSLGGAMLSKGARSPLTMPCVGDWVVLRSWTDGPKTIEAVLPRRTTWVWPGAARAQAANLDAVLLDDPAGWRPEDLPTVAAPPVPFPRGFTLGLLGVGRSVVTSLETLTDDGLIMLPDGGVVLEISRVPDSPKLPRQLGRQKMSEGTDTVADWRPSGR
ncbi:hypothetical protein R8Z50_07515 [Longispora sp. K20-0274]|uniref:hypothetical protein n=1 Tax=Longispora sp. K20-0274 TaxID=3088255 RepID=UPI00399A8B4D